MRDSPLLQTDLSSQLSLTKAVGKAKKVNSEGCVTSNDGDSNIIITTTLSNNDRIADSGGIDQNIHKSNLESTNIKTDTKLSAKIMNNQYYGASVHDHANSNLHLLSKVITDTENEIHRATTGTLTKPIQNDIAFSQMKRSPTTKADSDSKNEVKPWKKKAILDMDVKEDNEGDGTSQFHSHTSPSSPATTSAIDPIAKRGDDLRDDNNNDEADDDIDDDDDDRQVHVGSSITNDSNGSNEEMNTFLHPMTPLPADFKPGPYDVLCGRGKTCKEAPGNKAYRDIIMNQLQIYADATTKLEKGQIISNIMDQIKKQCYEYHGGTQNIGGFVKCVNGRWYEVGEFLAREKTSQCFRDALSALYSSSAQSKYLRRRASKVNGVSTGGGHDDNINNSMHHHFVVDQLAQQMITNGLNSNLLNKIGGDKVNSKKDTKEVTKRSEDVIEHPTKKLRRATQEDSIEDAMLQAMKSYRGNALKLRPERSPALNADSTVTNTAIQSGMAFINAPSSSINFANSLGPATGNVIPRLDSRPQMKSLADSFIDVCALQVGLRSPDESPWEAITRSQRQMEKVASTNSVDLFVLPELAPIGYSEDTFTKYLPINSNNQAMFQEFDRLFQVTARKLNAYICYGTIGWSYENRNVAMIAVGVPRLFIRQIVVDRLGTQVACYDKTYLCNYGACAETRYFQPGPASVPTSFAVYSRDRSYSYRFGLLICSDMRYAHLSNTLVGDAEHRVDCILQPAAFIRDISFRTWKSFRETRAVENSTFWIGINYAGTNYGDTTIVPPFVDDDHEPVSLPHDEGYVIGRIARSTLDHARNVFPFYNYLLAYSASKPRR